MWRVAQASVAGTAHLANGRECEDACSADTWLTPSGESVLALFAADGAGSASCGKAAAEFLCSSALEKIRTWTLGDEFSAQTLTVEQVHTWVQQLREQLLAQAALANQSACEWACTLLGVVCTAHAIGYLQLGDGAIVARSAHAQNERIDVIVHWPQSGEFINETRFLTDETALEHLQVTVQPRIPQALALLTDGLQRLAIEFPSYQPHGRFFDPLFAGLQALPSNDTQQFAAELRALLGSARVNARTDDDKTLLLASWHG